MDNSSQFDQFVSEIRLTDRQRETCVAAHKEVREKLISDSDMGKTVVSTFLQGSYVRHTIIKPSGDSHIDVDVVVVTKLSRDEFTPSQVISQFTSFLEANYRGRYKIQGRSIGISFPTVDLDLVITAAPSESVIGILKSEMSEEPQEIGVLFDILKKGDEWKSEPLLIPDREAGQWVPTFPLKQIEWTKQKNDATSGHFVNVVKVVKLHAGFNIVVILEDINEPDNIQIATSLVDRILDTISFSTVAQCEPQKLLTEIKIKNDGTSEGQFFEGPDPDSSIIIGTPRAIDENVFKEIWKACDRNPNEERILRVLAWFRKAIRELYNIDQFISLFVALEVVKPLLRDLLKTRVKDPSEWEGVIEIFNKKIKGVDFGDINLARNELLHGFKALAPEFGSRISAYLESLRRAIIYGLGDILGLSGQITDLICSYKPRRLFLKSQIGLKGHFRNLPELDVLLKRFPEIEINRKPMSFSIETDGKLNITFNTSQKFALPEKTVFEADTFVMTGSEGAGLDLARAKFNE